MKPKPLNPLIPLDELKKVLGEIVNASPEKVERVKVRTKRKSISVKAKLRTKEVKPK
ncbi:MAG TPA: hypothetical protein VMT95_03010 [Candidatus Binatia bacterium]|nr:hypothetical protein [Candidatus Binatia bacterium]